MGPTAQLLSHSPDPERTVALAARLCYSARDVGDLNRGLSDEEVGSLLGKRAEVNTKVEPALLGGFQVRVGQYLIDMSLKTKLDGLSQRAAVDSLR